MDSETGVIGFTDKSVPTRVVGAVQAEVDGELILLSPKDFSYFGAAGTGGPVWGLVDGTRTVGQIITELEAQYEANPGVIRAETVEFIDALRAAGLVEFTG